MGHPLAARLRRLTPLDDGELDSVVELCAKPFIVAPKCDFLKDGGNGHLHVLLEGWAYKYKIGHDGRRRVAMLYLPGDVLDLDRIYASGANGRFTALARCLVARIDRSALIRRLSLEPRIAHSFAALAVDENRRLAETVSGLAARTARERLCHLICEVATRMKLVGLSNGNDVEWPLVQEQVAEIIGLTPVHLNRVLQEVRAEGLIAWKGSQLRILDWHRTALFADFDAAHLDPAHPDPALRGLLEALPHTAPCQSPEDPADTGLAPILRGEIVHRMKNLFGVVQALVSQSLRDVAAEPIGDLRERLLARLQTLSKGAEELAENDWREGSLRSAVEKALSVYRGTGRIDWSGPDIRLDGQSLLALVLALHELQTNAMKHGALSSSEGRVLLLWKVLENEAGKQLWLQWSEHGGPATQRPERQGFGTRILTWATPRALTGQAQLDYTPEGLTWLLTAPLAGLVPAGQ